MAQKVHMDPKQVRQFRARHKLSQEQAARKFGVNRSTWVRWESGKRRMPGPAKQLAKVLDAKP